MSAVATDVGIRLVMRAQISAVDAGLGHPAARLLVYMATRALDTDQRPIYSGGRHAATVALGYDAESPRAKEAIKKVVAELTSSGLISLHAKPHTGRGATYALHLPKSGEAESPLFSESRENDSPQSDGVQGKPLPSAGKIPPEWGEADSPPRRAGGEQEESTAPPRFCGRHPNGTSAPCGACGEARRTADAWKPPRRPAPLHTHKFDGVSGYCGCGIREDAA